MLFRVPLCLSPNSCYRVQLTVTLWQETAYTYFYTPQYTTSQFWTLHFENQGNLQEILPCTHGFSVNTSNSHQPFSPLVHSHLQSNPSFKIKLMQLIPCFSTLGSYVMLVSSSSLPFTVLCCGIGPVLNCSIVLYILENLFI